MQNLQKLTPEQLAAAILDRVEKSSPDKLLASLSEELALLHQASEALEGRIAAAEKGRPSGLAPLASGDQTARKPQPRSSEDAGVAKSPKAKR